MAGYRIHRVRPIENMNGAITSHEAWVEIEYVYALPMLAFKIAQRMNDRQYFDYGDDYFVVVPVGGSAFSHRWIPPRPLELTAEECPF